MAFDLNSISKVKNDRPPIIVIHGSPGIGKTTFALNVGDGMVAAEDTILIRTEDGLGNIEANAFPIATSYDDVIEAIGSIAESDDIPFKWIVIDSLSALEPLIFDKVAKQEGKEHFADIGYGKGPIMALDYWGNIFKSLEIIGREKGIGSILIAHSDIVENKPPDMPSYHRTQIKLNKHAFQLVYEKADIIGYAAPEVFIAKEGDAKSLKGQRNMASGSGRRFLHLVEKPAFIAKNRYQMPEKMNLDWPEFQASFSK